MAAAILYWSCDPAEAEEAKQRSNGIAKVRLLAPSAGRYKKEAIIQKEEHLLSRELGHQKGHTKGQGQQLLNGSRQTKMDPGFGLPLAKLCWGGP